MEETSKKSIDVNVLGQSIRIKHEDEDYIRVREKYVNATVDSIQKHQKVSNVQLAARVLIVIADDYHSTIREKESFEKSVDEKARQMIDFIDDQAAGN